MNASESNVSGESTFPEWERVDTGPLSWVMSQLREALNKSLESLRAFAANPEDTSALKIARNHLHQAHGALQIVNLEGVSLLTEEIEGLFETFENDAYACTSEAIEAIAAAYRAVVEYLEELLAGSPHQPVRLFPSYRALLDLRSADRIHPADLFYPDLSIRPPRQPHEVDGSLKPAEVAAQRTRFERALLQYLRDDRNQQAKDEMRDAVTAIEAQPKQGQQRAFWWVTRAFFEALSANAIPADLNVKRLCARINLQVRRLLDGSGTVAERLLRDTLFFVARSAAATPHIGEVKHVYSLENSLPDDFENERFGRINFAALRSAKEALTGAKTAWGLVMAGDQSQIAGFARDTSTLLTAAGSLGRPGLVHISQVVASIATELSFDPRKPSEAVGLDVATALLFVENALEQIRSLDEQFDSRAASVVARVESSALGNPVSEEAVPWLDEMSRQAQERLSMASFVAEMQTNLRSIEKVLDTFFRDPTQRAELPAAEQQLAQIGGALAVLGHEQARQAIENGRATILRFADPAFAADTKEFERLAHSLGAIGFYIESLQHRSDMGTVFRFDEATGSFVADLGRVPKKEAKGEGIDPDPEPHGPGGGARPPAGPEHSSQSAETVEAEIAQHSDLVARLAEVLRSDPENQAAREQLGHALQRVQQDALLVDDSKLKDRAVRALKVLRDAPVDEAQNLTASVFDLTERANRFGDARDLRAPLPVPAVSAPVPTQSATIDAELLEIFLTEAVEVLGTARTCMVEMADAAADSERITTLRRCFHTLKGSGRMVGLMAFGEAAWGVEQTMNLWISEARPATPELLTLLNGAIVELGDWVKELTDSGVSARTPDALIAAAAALRGALPTSVSAAPVVPPIQADWTSTEVVDALAPPTDEEQFPEALAGNDEIGAEDSEHLNIDFDLPLAAPEPAGLESVDAAPAAQPPTPAVTGPVTETVARAEDVKEIGPLTLAVPLFNIYLAEADELLRTLSQDFGEWQHELNRLASHAALRAAHSLAGSSATVGLTPVHDLAYALEAVLQVLSRERMTIGEQELDLFKEAVNSLRSMLHRFAAETFPETDLPLMARLFALRDAAKAQRDGAVVVNPDSFAPTVSQVLRYAHEEPPLELPPEDLMEPMNLASEEVAAKSDGPGAEVDITLDAQEYAELEPGTPDEAVIAVHDPVSTSSEPVAQIPAAIESSESFEETKPVEIVVHEEPTTIDQAGLGGENGAIHAASDLSGFEELPAPVTIEPAPAVLNDLAAEQATFSGAAAVGAPHVANVRDEIDPELIGLFLQEASEYLPQIGESLRNWQSDRGNAGHPQALMRMMHTVKGSARMAGAMRLGELVHEMETRVEAAAALRDIPRTAFEELLAGHDQTLELYDALMHPERVVAARDESPDVDEANYRGVERRAGAMIEAQAQIIPKPVVGAPQAFLAPATPTGAAPVVQAVRVRADLLDRLVNQAGEVSISRSRLENEVGQIKTSLTDLTDNLGRLRSQLREVEIQAETSMQSRMSLTREGDQFDPLEFDRFTRLQELTRMMAESVNDVATVHQNLLRSLDGANRDLSAQQRMTRDLQQDLMRVRMVPFSSVSERLYRVVRQTAKELDKRVNLDVRGGGVEIDRSVLERMVAPFEHLLRNAIVHGVESPAARQSAGKLETGELLIEVRQEGNEIVIVFSDDGAGLNLARIRQRAEEAGLIEPGEELPNARAADLIFQPGFSTATEVTELAGRGVGMDVVRAEAGGLGGRVTVGTDEGRGTRFTINLPLTLAVTQVVLVEVAGRTYALPSVLVEQVQQLRPQPLAQAYNDGQIMWLNNPVRLHFLAGLLGERDRSPIAQRYSPVLVLRSGGERIAVHVDQVIGNQEVVVKNVGPQLARMPGIAGATVLGSGDIVLILNPVQLAQRVERDRGQTPAVERAEVGGAVAELIEQPARSGARAEAVAGLETLPSVMVVDDSLTVRRVTQRLLTREGYQVVLAKDGVDALQQLQDYTPDVMLVDIEMPRMDGYDLTRNVRGDERYHKIPIIMITSRTADKHRSLALELGVNVYLGKPFQDEELLAHLKRFVGARHRARA